MNTEEIMGLIKKQVTEFNVTLEFEEVGYVTHVGDSIARIYGLEKAAVGELVEFPSGTFGFIFSLERESVGVAILGDDSGIKEADQVKRTGRIFQVPVGEELLGRVIDPMGQFLDGKASLPIKKMRPIEAVAPGIIDRQPVNTPLQTGIKAIDAVIPIGRGQRELIIGDRQTGKTAIAVDAILNQKNEGVICIYVAIGQKQSIVSRIVEKLERHGAMAYTVIVSATANDSAPMQYIAPYSGCAIAEYFMWQGKDVLIIYDDLSKHAVAYRQLSLLLRRPPGREAYPGDVFYLHSRLLERAVKLSDEKGGGSITALPIIETYANDISAYIPTNVISITDGQIYLESGLFFGGNIPAVDVGLSVSRVGGAAQKKAMRQVAGRLRLDIAQYRALSAFAQFGSELDAASVKQIQRGERITEILKQDENKPLPLEKEILIIYAAVNGFLDDIAINGIKAFEQRLFETYDAGYSGLTPAIRTEEIDGAAALQLAECINKAKESVSCKI